MGSSYSLKEGWHAPLSAFSSPVLWSALSAHPSVALAFHVKKTLTHKDLDSFLRGALLQYIFTSSLHTHAYMKTTLPRAPKCQCNSNHSAAALEPLTFTPASHILRQRRQRSEEWMDYRNIRGKKEHTAAKWSLKKAFHSFDHRNVNSSCKLNCTI